MKNFLIFSLFMMSIQMGTAQSKRDLKEAERLADKGRWANTPAEMHRYFLEAWEVSKFTDFGSGYAACVQFLKDILHRGGYKYPETYAQRLDTDFQPLIQKDPGEGNYYIALSYAWYATVKDSAGIARAYYNRALKSKTVDGYTFNYMSEIFNPALAEANRRKAAEKDSLDKIAAARKAPTPETNAANDRLVIACWNELDKELGKIRSRELAAAASDITAANKCIRENNTYCVNLNVNSAISNLAVAKEFVNFARRIVANYSNQMVNPAPQHEKELSSMRSSLSEWEKSIGDKIKELRIGRKEAIQNMGLQDLWNIRKSYF